MAVVADRVIVELEAKLDRYNANVQRAEQAFNAATRKISNDAKRMEAQITASSTAIGARMRGLATTFAAGFSLRAVQQLADGYTRFVNQLAVAGLEGEKLAKVQNGLFEIGQRYGVGLENLGSLYSRVSQSAADLGATQEQIMQVARGTAAAFKVQGAGAAAQAQATLGLVQALGSATIHAEEFNQINDAAPSIMRAVAQNLDAASGSVSRLRMLVVNGKVSNTEFFDAFLKGSTQLENQASKASLTIANSFTVLNNALGKYIGEADDSLSATERVSAGIIALSNNLDTVVEALALLSTVLLGRYVAGLVAAGAATGVVSTAIFAMQARAIGAATTMEALALTSATAGRAMLAAFGGPVGLAVTALAAGIYYLATAVDQTGKANEDYVKQLDYARQATDKATSATDALANSQGRAREMALANAKALREETIQALANARAKAAAARADLQTTIAENRQRIVTATQTVRGAGGGLDPFYSQQRINRNMERSARANIMAAEQAAAEYEKQIYSLDQAINAAPNVRTPAPGKTPKPARTRHPRERQGTDPDEIARRFQDDLDRGELEYKAAMADVTNTAQARAELERARIRSEHDIAARDIQADKDLSAAQKQQLLALNDRIAAAKQEAVNAAERERQQADALELSQGDLQNQRDLLQSQAQLANTTAERKALALRILELEYQEQRARLQAIADNARLDDAQREAARRRLALLDDLEAADKASVDRQYEGAGKKYLRELNAKDINEQIEEVKVRGLQTLEDKIVDVTSKIFKMGGAFGEVANQIISDLIRIGVQQAIIKPLATALFGGDGSSGGGGLGGIFGGIINSVLHPGGGIGGGLPGRASGGHVMGGRIYRVNETGIEGFQPAGSGKIIPLGRMRAPSAGVSLYQTVNVDARGVNPDGFAEHIKASVRRETVAIVGAGMRQVTQGVPARLAQYQRDGT